MMRIFYDLTCPFCYLAQPLIQKLIKCSVHPLVELPFQAHPDIPSGGVHMGNGRRRGPMYEYIATRAKSLGLPLRWRDKLPNSRLALAAAEWTRHNHPDKADEVRAALFHAHFVGDRDIGDLSVVVELVANGCGVDQGVVELALENGSAMKLVDDARRLAHGLGVVSTPSWELDGIVVAGLQEQDIEKLIV